MSRKTEKVLKTICLSIIVLAAAVVLSLGCLCLWHQTRLKEERSKITHLSGQYVEIDGHDMNVYTEGGGEKTLVFLPGSLTPSPIFDFKPLYAGLTDKYRIVVIEKFGYGYSDECEGERSVDVIVKQDREALAALNIEGPFILVPHSASGLEAVYWANKYPAEIEAIIGLDPAVPEQYDFMPGTHITEMAPQDPEEAVKALAVSDFFSYKIGLMRIAMNPDDLIPALGSDALSEEEKEQYRALFYVRFCAGSGSTMMRETICDEQALQVLLEIYHAPLPDIPTLFFVSDDKDMLSDAFGSVDNWHRIHENYISKMTTGDIIYLDCGHYVHVEKPEEITEKMVDFIDSLEGRNK